MKNFVAFDQFSIVCHVFMFLEKRIWSMTPAQASLHFDMITNTNKSTLAK